MAPQKALNTNADIDSIAEDHSDIESIAESSVPSLDSLTANPKNQGTYRMLPPAGTQDYGKSGVMVPYGNINSVRKLGFNFDPHNGDDTRYAHDLFTELNSKGKAPTVESNDEESVNQYGVVPTPAPGTKEWAKRQGIKTAHSAIDMLPTAGAIVGGLATGVPGAATGPGDIAIAGGGATGGAAAGEDLRQILNSTFFGEKLTEKESAKRIAVQAALGGAQEVGGRAIGVPLGKAAKALGFTANEGTKAGIRLLPSEAAGKAPTWMEEFLKGSILSKGIMENFRETQNKESLAAANKLMDSISNFKGTPEQLGNMVQDGLDQATQAFHDQQNALYDALDSVTEKPVTSATPVKVRVMKNGKPVLDAAGNPVMHTVMQTRTNPQVMPSMVDLKKFARQQLDEINKPPYVVPKDVLEQARGTFQTILSNPDQVSFKRMRAARSALLSTGRNLEQALGNSKSGLVKKLTQITDKSLEDAAKNSNIPGLYDRWREANALTAEWHRVFEQKLVDKTVETGDPEFISKFIAGNNVGLDQTRDLFKVLPLKLHDPVRRGLLQDAVTKATEPRSGAFDEGKFASYVDKLGDERGKIIFGPNWKNVKGLVDIIGKINGPVGLSKGGGASLQNVGIMKRILGAAFSIPAAAAVATGVGTGHLESGLVGGAVVGLGGLGTEAASARTLAWAMVNPAKASKMLNAARAVLHETPYVASSVYHIGKDISPRELKDIVDLIKRSANDLTTPNKNSPAAPGGQSSVARPKGLAGQAAYNHIAVHPQTGHRAVSHDGTNWFDPNTGAKVA